MYRAGLEQRKAALQEEAEEAREEDPGGVRRDLVVGVDRVRVRRREEAVVHVGVRVGGRVRHSRGGNKSIGGAKQAVWGSRNMPAMIATPFIDSPAVGPMW